MSTLRKISVRVLSLLALFGVAACGTEPTGAVDDAQGAVAAAAPGPLTTVSVAPARPVPTTDGKRHLLYELFLTNDAPGPTQLTKVDVIDPDCPRATLASYTGDALARILEIDVGDVTTGTIAVNGHAGLFFDLARPLAGPLPARLAHRITVVSGGP